MNENLVWVILSRIKGLGPKTLLSIYKTHPNLQIPQLLSANGQVLLKAEIKNKKIMDLITDDIYIKGLYQQVVADIDTYNKNNIKIITIADRLYPKILRDLEDPPIVLYCRGNIEALTLEKKVAVVGTRNATAKGVSAAIRVAQTFSKMNYGIVSGLAKGIDEAAHKGTLEVGGITIAVLPGGVDPKSIYPAENKKLAEEIVNTNGLLVSEYPPFQRPNKASFVQRDRIQSGLSLGVCPIQTDITGGTQHTIKFTQKQKRLLFCPTPTEEGDIPAYRGIHKLIIEGNCEVLKAKRDYEYLDMLMRKILSTSLGVSLNKSKSTEFESGNLQSVIDDVCKIAKQNGLSEDELINMVRQQWGDNR